MNTQCMGIRGEGSRNGCASQPQRIGHEIIAPRVRDTQIYGGLKRYAELIGNYENQGIKSLWGNNYHY